MSARVANNAPLMVARLSLEDFSFSSLVAFFVRYGLLNPARGDTVTFFLGWIPLLGVSGATTAGDAGLDDVENFSLEVSGVAVTGGDGAGAASLPGAF